MKNAFRPQGQSQSRRVDHAPGEVRPAGGFTVIELLVLVAIAGMVAMMVLPALSGARQRARGMQCVNNLKQLGMGWTMYSGDNSGLLVPNGELTSAGAISPSDPALQPGGEKAQWCPGNMQGDGAAAAPYGNAYIQAGLLYPFVNNLAIYKCPADQSVWPYPRQSDSQPRVRSVSMNCWLNPVGKSWNARQAYTLGKAQKVFTTFAALSPSPGPGQTWVFIDESPATLDDGFFVCDLAVKEWNSVPATAHNGAGGISFADGHAQIRQWSDPKVRMFANFHAASPALALSNRDVAGDLAWLQQSSSILLQTQDDVAEQGF